MVRWPSEIPTPSAARGASEDPAALIALTSLVSADASAAAPSAKPGPMSSPSDANACAVANCAHTPRMLTGIPPAMVWFPQVLQYPNQPSLGSKASAALDPWPIESAARSCAPEFPVVAACTMVACAVAPDGLVTWGGGENWGSLTAPAEVAA